MRGVMSTMIGGDDDERTFTKTSFIQSRQNHTDGFIRAKGANHVIRREPAVGVPKSVNEGQMNEHQIKTFRDEGDGPFSDNTITVIDIDKDIGVFRHCDLAQLLFTNNHHGTQTGFVSDLQNRGAGRESIFGNVIVPIDAVFVGAHTGQHR